MVLPHPFSTPLGGLGKNSYSKLSSGNMMHISQHCIFNNVNSQMVGNDLQFHFYGGIADISRFGVWSRRAVGYPNQQET
jgi:hypothetical protein